MTRRDSGLPKCSKDLYATGFSRHIATGSLSYPILIMGCMQDDAHGLTNGSFPELLTASDEALILDDQTITQGLTESFKTRTKADMAMMGYIVAAERMDIPRRDGFDSTEDWVTTFLGIGYMNACAFLEAARSLRDLPHTRRAYADGKITYDHVRALVKVAGEYSEQDLLQHVIGRSVADAWRITRSILEVSREDSNQAKKDRWVETRWDFDNRCLLLFGKFPEEMGARVENALDALAEQLPDEPDKKVAKSVKRADALVALAASRLSELPDRANVVVHIDHTALVDNHGVAILGNGVTTSPETARQMACDASIEAVVVDGNGEPVGVGRRKRSTPGWLRRLVLQRDKTCRFGNCRAHKHLIPHHKVHWADGGPTDLGNLVMFCSFHHDLIHANKWKVVGDAPRVWIERPGKLPIKAGPPP